MFKRSGLVRLLLFFLFFGQAAFAQVVIKGRVTDAANGDPIPFASVGVLGLNYGTTTNFQGEFTLHAKSMTDSLFASVVGYRKRIKWVDKKLKVLELDFQLESATKEMAEVLVYSGENPAFKILRNVLKHRERNDRSKLESYEYSSYSKMELDVDNISDKFKDRKVMKDISDAVRKFEKLAGEDGKLIIPNRPSVKESMS